MLSFTIPEGRVQIRAAAVIIHNEHILLHRAIHDNFWALPGGRCEFGEPSPTTIVREMQEEIGATVNIERMLWFVENTFSYNNVEFHEYNICYLVSLVDRLEIYETPEWEGTEGDLTLIFKWFPIATLKNERVYPTFLQTELHTLSEGIKHIIHRDPTDE